MENLINGLKNNRAFAFSSFGAAFDRDCVSGAVASSYDPLEATMKNAYLPPSSEHLLELISWGEIISVGFCMVPAIL